MISKNFTPALCVTFLQDGYSLSDLRHDLVAGLTVAIVALPLAMAMAVASGASPDQGIVTSVVAGFFISALGGSRVQIGGPTGAFVVVIFDIISRHGYDGLIVATIMAGLMLLTGGYMGLGQLIRYIPYPVITGFTTGIAVIIASSQIKDFFGFTLESVPANFLEQWETYLLNLDLITVPALLLSLGTLAVIILCKKISDKLPGYLIAIIAASLACYYLPLNVDTIGSRFPDLPSGLPLPEPPDIRLDELRDLLAAAATISFLAGVEALLSAVVADGMTGQKHSMNQELIGQGVANVASGMFGGIPATGAIARTAANIKSGGRTPMAGIFHSLFLLIFLYVGMEILAFIPMAALAAILFMVAYGMSDLRHFFAIFRISATDRNILIITFGLTILVDLTVSIGVGVGYASLMFMHHMSRSLEVTSHSTRTGLDDVDPNEQTEVGTHYDIPDHVSVFQINGPMFFGVSSELQDRLERMERIPKILILRLRFMPYLDASGELAIEHMMEYCAREKTFLLLSDLRPQPMAILSAAHIERNTEVGFARDFKEAVEMCKTMLADSAFYGSHHDDSADAASAADGARGAGAAAGGAGTAGETGGKDGGTRS